ncbi:hypothetical protein AAC387_Pa04g2567 [Persea americana]
MPNEHEGRQGEGEAKRYGGTGTEGNDGKGERGKERERDGLRDKGWGLAAAGRRWREGRRGRQGGGERLEEGAEEREKDRERESKRWWAWSEVGRERRRVGV